MIIHALISVSLCQRTSNYGVFNLYYTETLMCSDSCNDIEGNCHGSIYNQRHRKRMATTEVLLKLLNIAYIFIASRKESFLIQISLKLIPRCQNWRGISAGACKRLVPNILRHPMPQCQSCLLMHISVSKQQLISMDPQQQKSLNLL